MDSCIFHLNGFIRQLVELSTSGLWPTGISTTVSTVRRNDNRGYGGWIPFFNGMEIGILSA
jgi:hypothetical protein